jgi:hypothetical protein
VAESNQGGELVKSVIEGIDPLVPVTLVNAKVGKRARAEPVAAAYEKGRVHHLSYFTELEDQWTTWSEDQGHSPDRMDACVWGLTALLVREPDNWVGRLRAVNPGLGKHLPDVRDFDPHRAAEPRKPRGKELEDLTKALFGIDPTANRTLADNEEAGLPRRLTPAQQSLRLSSGDSIRGRSNTYRPPGHSFR